MDAQFEEKQFEAALNQELSDNGRFAYVPGQVLEASLGIDAAVFSSNPHFWGLFPAHPRPPRGVVLDPALWRLVDRSIQQSPPLLFNVFLQHKRPQYLVRSNSSQWALWNGPYYRFPVRAGQQDVLARLENAVGTDGVVSYAAPAFHTLGQLWACLQQQDLAQNVNFAAPSRLAGHAVYTYTEAGNHGQANPDPEHIESPDPRELIAKARDRSADERAAQDFITHTSQVIESVTDAAGGPAGHLFAQIRARQVREDGPVLARALGTIHAFCFVYNVTWSLPEALR